MIQTSGMLRHLAFFEELGRMEDTDAGWRAVSAGLVVMRLIDQWVESRRARPAMDVVPAAPVAAVREAIDEIGTGRPAQRVLTSIVDALTGSRTFEAHVLCPRLMAYGQTLEYEARWSLAADVYQTVLDYVSSDDDADVVIAAYQQLGFCRRTMSDFDGALEAYEHASSAALRISDLVGVLRARLGVARIVMARGNMPKAEAMLAETVEQARSQGLDSIRASALNDRAYLAGVTNDHARAIEYSYEALELSSSQRLRDRVLNNIATGFRHLGLYDAARDAYLIIAATGGEQYMRWMAELNLIELSALQQLPTQFETIRRRLDGADLSPELRVTYYLHVGRGYHALGRSDVALPYLKQAVALAEDYQLNQMLFEAETALAEAGAGTLRVKIDAVDAAAVPTQVRQVASAIHELRSVALAGG